MSPRKVRVVRKERLRWTQAEILQIMEEIERYGAGPLSVFCCRLRHNLERAYNAILQMDGQSKAVPTVSR
ncbi:MAG: hypothetical protein R2856_25920 [Caldilineaceae bacterium]